MIDTLFFDMDDTLVAYDAVSELSWRQVCKAYLPESDDARVETIYRAIRKQSNWYWSDPERNRAGRQNMLPARREIVSLAFTELGFPHEDAADVADHFSKLRLDNMYLMTDTAETLNYFRAQSFKMALLTNGDPPGQRAKIARFNLAPYFDLILIEGEIGFGKPDRRVFDLALQQLGSDPARTLMVGDNLVWDIEGAQAVGIKAVWYDWRKASLPQDSKIQPFAIITGLAQLRAVVAKLNQ